MPLRVLLIVLGDFGRSPRMQYHAAALAREGASIDVIALRGKPPIDELTGNQRVTLHLLPPLEPLPSPLRMALHAIRMSLLFFAIRRPDVILVQNPPAFPAVPLALVFGRIRGAAVVVDWHNLTSAMAALRLRSSRMVELVRRAEEAAGRRADAALAVSEPLREHLEQRRAANVILFPDAPWRGPREGDRQAGRSLLRRIAGQDASLVAMTATSWSADEDNEWLLDAAAIADDRLGDRSVAIVVTGDGPRRSAFEFRLRSMRLRRVRMATAWLDAKDYRDALRGADVGICLHRSASGLDFPMKIADMRGSGLPVCVLDSGAKSIRETLRQDGGTRFFTGPARLADLLTRFAGDDAALEAFRREVPPNLASWDDEWKRIVQPLVTRLAAGS